MTTGSTTLPIEAADGSGLVSINGDTTPTQTIAAGAGVSVSSAGGTTTIANIGVISVNADTTSAQVIAGGTGISVATVAGTTTITNSLPATAAATQNVNRFTVTGAQLTSAGDGVKVYAGALLPDNAIVTRMYFNVDTAITYDGDGLSTIAWGTDAFGDFVTPAAVATLPVPYDTFRDAGNDGTIGLFFHLTPPSQLYFRWDIGLSTDTVLGGGPINVYMEWVSP